ncbi:uncharacterized protein [Nicotiana sylvestris]|uniref:uncharacterized protein n=1 Tax=Nicotiana sylvestris TaxID=4096 RepID=UPI00388CCF60
MERQYDDPHLLVLKDKVHHGDARDVTIGDDGVLWMQGQICVPNVDGLRELILEEAHSSQYSIHPSNAKMYKDLRQHYWWKGMKKDIVGFVARCLNCQQMKYVTSADRDSGVEVGADHHRLYIPELELCSIDLSL